MDTSRKWRRGFCIKKVAPRSYLVDIKGSIYRRNRKFLRIAKDWLRGTLQENREPLNPETAQANPGTQTPCQQLKPPLLASRLPPDNIHVSHRDSATLQADPSSSISPTTPEETPLIGQLSSPAPSVVQRTRRGRIITLPTRLNL